MQLLLFELPTENAVSGDFNGFLALLPPPPPRRGVITLITSQFRDLQITCFTAVRWVIKGMSGSIKPNPHRGVQDAPTSR